MRTFGAVMGVLFLGALFWGGVWWSVCNTNSDPAYGYIQSAHFKVIPNDKSQPTYYADSYTTANGFIVLDRYAYKVYDADFGHYEIVDKRLMLPIAQTSIVEQ